MHEPTDQTRAVVKCLVCHGATLETLDKIADIYGITIEELHRHYAHEIRTGPEDARRDFLEQLRRQALAEKESPIRRLARQVVMILKPFEQADRPVFPDIDSQIYGHDLPAERAHNPKFI